MSTTLKQEGGRLGYGFRGWAPKDFKLASSGRGVRVGPAHVRRSLQVGDGVGTPRLLPGVISGYPVVYLLLESSWHPANILDTVTKTINNRTSVLRVLKKHQFNKLLSNETKIHTVTHSHGRGDTPHTRTHWQPLNTLTQTYTTIKHTYTHTEPTGAPVQL